MQWKQIFATSALTAVFAIFLVCVGGWAMRSVGFTHGGYGYGHHWGGGYGGIGHYGSYGMQGSHGMARLCSADRDVGIDRMLNKVESVLGLEDGQTAAWTKFGEAVKAAAASAGEKCASVNLDGTTAADALDRHEAMMAAGSTALSQIRPAFEEFYGALNEQQRSTIDDFMNYRRGGWRGNNGA